MEYDEDVLEELHKGSFKNVKKIYKSSYCGCFCCLKEFRPAIIKEYCHDGQTAMCPFCGTDSVISSHQGWAINVQLLKQMHKKYFTINGKSIIW